MTCPKALWLGFDTLPGGFVTNTPLAGGEILSWEEEAFRVYGVNTRLDLNRFYLSAVGREILTQHLADGSYRLCQPEEAALMVAATGPDRAWTESIEPFMADVRFYPQTLDRGYQNAPFGVVCRYTCQDALEAFADYRLPLEVLRKRESLLAWRPFQSRMLKQLTRTTVDGWPFQHYPEGWSLQAEDLVKEIEARLNEPIVCHFPQRTDSDFRRLLSALKIAYSTPTTLTGREVAFCKTVLENSLEKSEQAGESALPGQEVLDALTRLETELTSLPPDRGLDPLAPILGDLPKALRKKVLRTREGTLKQLHDWGILSSLEVMDHLAPKLVGGVFSGPRANLLNRCYRTFSNRSCSVHFEDLPWLKPIWSTPPKENLRSAGRQILECWWSFFPHYGLSQGLTTQLTNLSRWLGLGQEKTTLDLTALIQATRPQIDITQALRTCRAYREQQRALNCAKPYQRQRRNKNLALCEQQERLIKELFLTSKSP
jgi:hypothetical protein